MPRIFQANRGNTALVSVINQVNSSQIRREVKDGESYIVVPSATLPDNVVMNGGFYPADEIEKSYMTLEGTHVPIEHPQDESGQYISAGAPAAMRRGYLIGAENKNCSRANGRVYVEKWIPERIANGCDKGKRLIDRLNALMAGKGEPIHTSTGILLERETVETTTAADGAQYNWIARNMVFDHDAILLDSVGAATPSQGVGIGVNSQAAVIDGATIDRIIYVNSTGLDMTGGAMQKIRDLREQVRPIMDKMQKLICEYLKAARDMKDAEEDLAEVTANDGNEPWCYIEDYNDDTIIFCADDGNTYAIGYTLEDNEPKLTGEPQLVKTQTQYVSANNRFDSLVSWIMSKFAGSKKPAYNAKDTKVNSSSTEGNSMKLLIAALNAKGVATEGMTEEQIFQAYNTMLAGGGGNIADQVAQAVNQALKPVQEELQAVKGQLQANADASKQGMVADLVAKDIGLSEGALKALELNELQSLHTKHCAVPAFGLLSSVNSGKPATDYDMPE